jgi:basic membrane protein A
MTLSATVHLSYADVPVTPTGGSPGHSHRVSAGQKSRRTVKACGNTAIRAERNGLGEKEKEAPLQKRGMRWFLALLLALAIVAAACAEEEPDEGGNGGGDGEVEQIDFTACQVTDTGGIDDRSFNQTAYEGLERAQEELGVEINFLESQSPNDFQPNIDTFIQQGCDLIITVGFLLGDATAEAAEANPDQKFAIVDFDFFDADKGEDITFDNVKELTFATDQAAFLAGYVAAGVSESGTIGTYGGINLPTVTIFMDGLAQGINYYNEQKGTDVQLLGWDPEAQDGTFTGDFEDQDKGRQVTESLLGEGADIILPVAGPVGLGSAAAVQDAGNASLIWVDTDGCVSASEFCDLFLTSILKNMNVAVFDSIQDAVNDEFEGGLYTGTLENDGVGLAPYHEFEDEVSDELKQEVEDIREQIISGEITVGG